MYYDGIFDLILQSFIDLTASDEDPDDELSTKNYNFPKLHLRLHLFQNIQDKGVARNFSTKPNEKMHGPLKFSYLHRSNFKNFGDQVSFNTTIADYLQNATPLILMVIIFRYCKRITIFSYLDLSGAISMHLMSTYAISRPSDFQTLKMRTRQAI